MHSILMAASDLPSCRAAPVTVRDGRSIYNGYRGFVERIQRSEGCGLLRGRQTADKLVRFRSAPSNQGELTPAARFRPRQPGPACCSGLPVAIPPALGQALAFEFHPA